MISGGVEECGATARQGAIHSAKDSYPISFMLLSDLAPAGCVCAYGRMRAVAICRLLTDNSLNRITATIEPVGTPRDFDLAAGAATGRPIVTLPVRIRLQNPFLGRKCYLGSADRPILLRPQNLTRPALSFEDFAADGTPDTNGVLTRIGLTGSDQGDTTFAVPGARGCGAGGILDGAVNLKTGLPSASGDNRMTLDDSATHLAGLRGPDTTAPDNGKLLSRYWHSAH